MAEGYGIWCITAGDWKRKSSKTEEWYSARDSNEDVKEKKKKERRIVRYKKEWKIKTVETVNVKMRGKVYVCGSHYEKRKVN